VNYIKILFLLSILWFFRLEISYAKVLCTITSDTQPTIGKLTYELDTNSGEILHLYRETYKDNALIRKAEINLDDLKSPLGATIINKENRDIVKFYSENFDKYLGGILTLDILQNAIFNNHIKYELEIYKESDELVLSYKKKKFKQVKLISNKNMLVGVIGINRAEFSN
jgi:hypothetical protein